MAGTLVLPSFYRVCSINLVVESRTDCVLFFLQPLVRGGARVLRHFARGSQVVRQNGAAQKARLPFCGTFFLRLAHFLSLLHLLFDLGASGSGDFLGSNFSLAGRFDDSVCICFSCVCVCVSGNRIVGQPTVVEFHVTVMSLDSIDESSMVCQLSLFVDT